MKYLNIREEELKNKIANEYFWQFDSTKIIGNVDFCVSMHQSNRELLEQESLLWAEAKKGSSDLYKSITQLILTIGKARTFDTYLPPAFLGAFDGEKIAFIPYNDIQDIFYLNDFNWNVAPSNYETREFKIVNDKVKTIIDLKALLFNYETDEVELKSFIKSNFIVGRFGLTKTRIDKNNFVIIYNKWLQTVKPTISVNWEVAKQKGVIDGDFYLADLLSEENITLKDKLFVVLKETKYKLNRHIDEYGAFTSSTVEFTDKQKAHNQFWNKYERPPKEEYWDYIINRRDLLVPQDVRERKGSFFTPQIWVELSQRYLTEALGENWQDEYYIWDCAAGTGNLLTGLTNKYKIWASTLDKQDVEVMKERIENGANLLEDRVFQFDFLNDDFTKLPKPLQDIINDPEKRKKLVIYINPPYAEASTGLGRAFKNKVATENKTHTKYRHILGRASKEIYIQFLARIYFEIPDCIIAEFSKLKGLQASNFKDFRLFFQSKLIKCFIVPANTFDNVKGQFPIGFKIWDTSIKDRFHKTIAKAYHKDGVFLETKNIYSFDKEKGNINDWLRQFRNINGSAIIGVLVGDAPDFQHNKSVCILNEKGIGHFFYFSLQLFNLIPACIYFAIRQNIKSTWLNDRDQFLYPNSKWEKDAEFQNDCLAYTLFHGQNRISSKEGINHWIPFNEYEVDSRDEFKSHFMANFIQGKLKPEGDAELIQQKEFRTTPLEFSEEAKAVFDAGLQLWKYYHKQPKCNVNASLYDIREHFQGRNEKGKMNNRSDDETYTKLISILRDKLNILALKIEPKIYEYGFLKM